jgi:PAS domain S-box-containing protein
MSVAAEGNNGIFEEELNNLFSQRAYLVFWLGIIFFLLFAGLDFLVHREFFSLFFTYRLVFVSFLLVCIGLLQFHYLRKYAQQIMVVALVCASLTISLMTVELGGFRSEYYIGIVLVAAFVSMLPLRVLLVTGLGLVMYLVYLITVKAGGAGFENDYVYVINNTFFYMAILFATVVKSYDDTQVRKEIWHQRAKVRQLQLELGVYTGNLEAVVQRRLEQIEELDFRYSELYDNIQDMVVALDEQGDIKLFNRRFAQVFAVEEERGHRYNFFDFLVPEQRREISIQLLMQFGRRHPFLGFEVQMITADQSVCTVEISGNWIDKNTSSSLCQLVLRNITHRKEIEQQMLESTRLVDRSRRIAIIGLAKLAEYRDADTGAHLDRIQEYTQLLTKKLSENKGLTHMLTPSFLEDITLSSVLHDIGKVGIPDSILLKPGKLSREEFDEMKNHSVYGSDSLAEAERDVGDVSFMTMGQEIAHFHHEKWDGTGYPLGLVGVDIPLSARIVALTDVYDAL